METTTITRVLAGPRRGSSRPVVVETPLGRQLVKLRGAAQGTGPLVAEIIVGVLAEALALPVLPRRLAILEGGTPSDDKDQELADLLRASAGLNLAFPMLTTARDARAADLAACPPADRAAIIWLDRLVLNPDRTNRNPNILWHAGRLHLIDHGSALRFQYDWSRVTEATPTEVGLSAEPHLFEAASTSEGWRDWDATFANRLTRDVLEGAVGAVPATFLQPLLPTAECRESSVWTEALRRRRAAYVAFLWKRLKPPRAFASGPSAFLPPSGGSRRRSRSPRAA